MYCKCGEHMTLLLADELIELYLCMMCDTYSIKNIECENYFYLKEI